MRRGRSVVEVRVEYVRRVWQDGVVGARVLLEMVFPAEPLPTGLTAVRAKPRVYPLVPRQFLVPCEALSTPLCVTFEGAFTCNTEHGSCYLAVNSLITYKFTAAHLMT